MSVSIELECFLTQMFEPDREPYTLHRIANDLAPHYPRITYLAVNRAWHSLYDSEHTRQLVTPLPERDLRRQRLFHAPAARRIAQRAVRGRLPQRRFGDPDREPLRVTPPVDTLSDLPRLLRVLIITLGGNPDTSPEELQQTIADGKFRNLKLSDN